MRQRGGNVFVIVLTILFLISVATAGYFWWQVKQLEEARPALIPSSDSDAKIGDARADIKLPVIVFEPDVYSDSLKQEFMQKMVSPFIDYNNETETNVVTILIEQNNIEATKVQYPYSFTGIFKDGVVEGRAVTVKDGKLNYWVPTCMGPCRFSPSFEKKYPQIVKLANP